MKSLSNYKGLLLPALLLACSIVDAERIDFPTAAKVASSHAFVMQKRIETCNNHSCIYSLSGSEGRPLCGEGTADTLAYVFALEQGGFVVVTADNDLVPVIAYAEQGSFPWDEDVENVLLHMLRKDLNLRLEAVKLLPTERIEEYHREWEGLVSGDPFYLDPGESWPPAGSTSTGGWVQTAWHQGSPYNDRCPIDPETGGRCVVGCVATAMAQIINYWQYPESVTFTEADNYTTDIRKIRIHAPDASIEHIDYNDGKPSDSTCAAISYACGVGTKMDYTSENSGANTSDCYKSLLNHFKYSSIRYKTITDDAFYKDLETNIMNAQPVLIDISKEKPATTRHFIICDGYRETDSDEEWHLNFGWGNDSPEQLLYCWYKLPEAMPSGYTLVGRGIFDIRPPSFRVNAPSSTCIICNRRFTINYNITKEARVQIRIFDASGRYIKTVRNELQPRGNYSIEWNEEENEGKAPASGIYFIQFSDGVYYSSIKLVILK